MNHKNSLLREDPGEFYFVSPISVTAIVTDSAEGVSMGVPMGVGPGVFVFNRSWICFLLLLLFPWARIRQLWEQKKVF